MKHKEEGIRNFNARNFDNALFHFSLALEENPNDKELRIYIILCDLAKEREDEAVALFEYYTLNLLEKKEGSEEELEEIVDSLDISIEKLHDLFESYMLDVRLESQDGILYEDFIELVNERGSFSKTFEDIMFSTKVIITEKKDFIHFLDLLVEHNFLEMALNYLESAISIFPTDESLRLIFEKVERITHS